MPEDIIIIPSGGTIQFIDTGGTTTTLTRVGSKLTFSAPGKSQFFTMSNVSGEGISTVGVDLNVGSVRNSAGLLIDDVGGSAQWQGNRVTNPGAQGTIGTQGGIGCLLYTSDAADE